MAEFAEVGRKLAKLRRQEGELKAALAGFDGQFGYGGHFEHERKAIIATLKRKYMDESVDEGKKMSNADADDLAHADEGYRSWLEKKRQERRQMNSFEAELAVVRAKIEEVKMERELAERRLRLNEELIRFARSEMRLS